MVELSSKAKHLAKEELSAVAEELKRSWIARGHQAWSRQAPTVHGADGAAGKHEESLLSEDRIVALELVAVEGIVPMAAGVLVLA